MGSLTTDLPIVQYRRLTDAQKANILDEIFMLVEYDEDDRPGADRSAGDIGECTVEILDRNGVRFSDVNHMPNGYRFNRHKTIAGVGCRWSLVSVVEPMSRAHPNKGNLYCPSSCPDSTIEYDPDAMTDEYDTLNVDAVIAHLNASGVRVDTVHTGGGTYTLHIGDGDPISLGACQRSSGRLTADQYDATYRLQPDGEPFLLDGCDDPQDVADHSVSPSVIAASAGRR